MVNNYQIMIKMAPVFHENREKTLFHSLSDGYYTTLNIQLLTLTLVTEILFLNKIIISEVLKG